MNSQKLSRPRGSADCPLGVRVYNTHRVMPKYTLIHWHPEMELLCVLQGKYELYAPDGPQVVTGGHIYLVPPGEDHGIRALEENGTYYSVAFTLDMVTGSPNHFLQTNFVTPLSSGTLQLPRVIADFDPLYDLILSQVEQLTRLNIDSAAYKLAAHVAANTICAGIAPKCQIKAAPGKGCSREHDAARTCVQYIHSHYAEKITVQLLAELVHLHPNYLCGLFKEHIGVSPISYINQKRIHVACELLQTTNLSLQQIADRVGMNSSSYFSRVFRQLMDISPGAYAALYHKNRIKTD